MLVRLQRQQHRQPIRQVIALVRFSLDAKEPVAIAGERPAWVKAAGQLAISTVGLTNLLEMNTTAVAQVNLDYDVIVSDVSTSLCHGCSIMALPFLHAIITHMYSARSA